MNRYQKIRHELLSQPRTWLVTGVAGFIGSNILETLLKLDQHVIGLDNFSTGKQANLEEVKNLVLKKQWRNFRLIEGDICKLSDCYLACASVDYVLHQAALGSVPRSLVDPIATNESNISGFLNMLVAARDSNTYSFTYAASSSTYGDHPALPKVEENIGTPLSPYAVSKYVNELYASVFARSYGFESIGLRYFNVFGPRQDPTGSYAAVIPKWTNALLNREAIHINGDGKTSRDFCYVSNVVQANLLAACAPKEARNQVYNVAVGDRTTLDRLFEVLRDSLINNGVSPSTCPNYCDFRPGDVRHSQADISKAERLLGYTPTHRLEDGIIETVQWHVNNK